MAGLTTHVLDTSKGRPAVNLKIELYKIINKQKKLINTFITNKDGRINEPLISDENSIQEPLKGITLAEYSFVPLA